MPSPDPAARAWYRRTYKYRRKSKGGEAPSYRQWQAICAFFDGCCAYCGEVCEGGPTVDHDLPLSRGGKHVASNVVPSCVGCNKQKGRRTSAEFCAVIALFPLHAR